MNIRRACLTVSLLTPVLAHAHHSFAEFDQNVYEEYEGEIVSIFWRNPHIGMSIRVEEDSGADVVWDMEAQDLNTLGRIGVTPEMFQVGQRVRFAGRRRGASTTWP